VRIDAFDEAMKAFGMQIGPFAPLDVVGLDTARPVGEVPRVAFGERVGTAPSG